MWFKATWWLPRAWGLELGELWILLALGTLQLSKGHTRDTGVRCAFGKRQTGFQARAHLQDPVPRSCHQPQRFQKAMHVHSQCPGSDRLITENHPLAGNVSSGGKGDVLLALVHREAADSDLVSHRQSFPPHSGLDADGTP